MTLFGHEFFCDELARRQAIGDAAHGNVHLARAQALHLRVIQLLAKAQLDRWEGLPKGAQGLGYQPHHGQRHGADTELAAYAPLSCRTRSVTASRVLDTLSACSNNICP